MTLGQRLSRDAGVFRLPQVIGQFGEDLFTLHPPYLSCAGERHNEGSAVRNLNRPVGGFPPKNKAGKKLAGASASIISPVSSRAFVSCMRSSPAAVTSSSTNSANAWWYIRGT